jgi:hypothetical protein
MVCYLLFCGKQNKNIDERKNPQLQVTEFKEFPQNAAAARALCCSRIRNHAGSR